ncbi:MAG: serine/threonine protein kinase [Deltaproteobacteria bacterium]|nr:serine/threonine protein kinase [Deltaproteobacteria bacterium]MCW5803991.1 serine/threonine protein kinase [Deltaproteobacteria bacterium]
MPDILAIVSKAIFERDARIDGELVRPGAVWPTDRYTSTNKVLQPLEGGGRIFLVTVRPPNEQLWFVGVVDSPEFDGTAWVAPAPNALPVTNITKLRRTIVFESGKGMLQDKGMLGMSLQAPRVLANVDVDQILAAVERDGAELASAPAPAPSAPPGRKSAKPRASKAKAARVIDGKYEIVRELGKGGMGVVYEARHTGTGRRVALKEILGDSIGSDPVLIERFQREARATGAIETQHIAPVLDTGSDPTTAHPYLVMELLQGEDLQDLIVRHGSLSEQVALRVIAQACAGLVRAHEAGVVHRDIKPANLFLARRDEEVVVKVLDFGLARVKEQVAASQQLSLTSTGLMLGTPLYMSPEQVMGAKDLDHRSDLWSLGVVLYEALTGTTPHGEIETLGALLVSICSKPAKPIQELAPEVRDSVAAIVKKSLEIDQQKRYQSAAAMLADIKKVLPLGTHLDETLLRDMAANPRANPAPDEAFSETTPSSV